jgi:hypothetical protein
LLKIKTQIALHGFTIRATQKNLINAIGDVSKDNHWTSTVVNPRRYFNKTVLASNLPQGGDCFASLAVTLDKVKYLCLTYYCYYRLLCARDQRRK